MMMRWVGTLSVSALALALGGGQSPSLAQVEEPVEPPPTVEPLTGVELPPLDGDKRASIVKSEGWLEVLGKALFWDRALGSDGNACASCHFHAGADPRVANQLSPGLLQVAPAADGSFGGIAPTPSTLRGKTRGGKVAAANIKLTAADFPFRVLADRNNRNSAILYDTNDVFSSQGVFNGLFVGLDEPVRFANGVRDFCAPGVDPIFRISIGGQPHQVRRVEPRNTPTMINAAFNFRNFWDGRANNVFNGSSPHGRRDTGAGIHRNVGGSLVYQQLELRNMSLASQAVGPPNSDIEMACQNRTFASIGRKLLSRTPLGAQKVAPTDSVFGAGGPVGNVIVPTTNTGLTRSYLRLVQAAFDDDLWNGPAAATGFSHAEENFDLFFGMAIDKYERSLISDRTKLEGFNGGLTAQEQSGKSVFEGKGKCVNCHVGPLLTGAAVPPRQRNQLVEHMLMGDNKPAFYDGGFYNIGVRPTNEDVGLGEEILGFPLSFSRQHVTGRKVDEFQVDESTFEEPCSTSPCQTKRLAVDGAFKTPGLRNVALTAPYFHNGGEATLEQVVEFYNRGGNRRGNFPNDTTGSGPLGQGPVSQNPTGTNLDADIQSLGLSASEKQDLVAFMKALTDDRVRCHKAPFDHPELVVPNGHKTVGAGTRAADALLKLRAVGRDGYNASACAKNSGNLFDYNLVGAVGSGKMLEQLP